MSQDETLFKWMLGGTTIAIILNLIVSSIPNIYLTTLFILLLYLVFWRKK